MTSGRERRSRTSMSVTGWTAPVRTVAGWRQLAADHGMGRVSADGPGPELAGVEYCPDAGDLAGCDLECVHGHGDAVLLGHQTGLAVDGALQEPHVAGCCAGEIGQVARDLLAAFDGPERGGSQAAAVAGHGGVGVEQADEGADVAGFPGLLEFPDDAGLPGGGGGGRLPGAGARAGSGTPPAPRHPAAARSPP